MITMYMLIPQEHLALSDVSLNNIHVDGLSQLAIEKLIIDVSIDFHKIINAL